MKKIVFFLALLCLTSCGQPEKKTSPSVLVTLPPYAYFVKKIAKEAVHVEILVPPGSNPHIYEPNPKQVNDILDTSVWFRIGDPIENKVLRVLKEHNPKILDVDLSEGLLLIEEHSHGHSHTTDEGKDRHFWLSPKIAQIQAKKIGNTLIEMFPEHQKQFTEKLGDLISELETLDREIAQKLDAHQGQAILVSHPAFGYFCQEFHLRQLSIECEGKDPLPKDIEQILKASKELGIKEVLTQIQYNNKAAILIGEQLQVPIYEVDPYAVDYVSNLLHITEIIAHEKD